MTNELLRQLAMEARELQKTPDERKATPKAKPSVEFTITVADYPDLVVTRSTPKTTKHLVILFTAGVGFIKSETNGKEAVSEPLTAESYGRFTSGMPELELPEGYWAPTLKKGSEFGYKLLDLLQNADAREAMKRGYFRLYGDIDRVDRNLYRVVRHIPKLAEEFWDKPKASHLLKEEPVFVMDINHRFGLNNARDFLRSVEESLVNTTGRYGRLGLAGHKLNPIDDEGAAVAYCDDDNMSYYEACSDIPATKMTYAAFKDYVLYSAVRFGYADNWDDFFGTWTDTLRMQKNIYGKVKEKYPDSLPTFHNQLAYKSRLMREVIDARKFAAHVEIAKRYEGKCGEYIFVAPHEKQDFYDEATAQCNCLASYVGSFTNGDCIILFMRKANTPDRSYITIEIRDGSARQIKLAHNANPSTEIRDIVNRWVAAHNSAVTFA